MEPRKRPLPDEDDYVVTKKRILTGANGGPHVNGMALEDEGEAFGDKLETYRKEAIYRRMKQYWREHERSKVRIQELERRKTTCEAGVAAISACWAQLVETIRMFVKTDEIPDAGLHAKGDPKPLNIYASLIALVIELFDLTRHLHENPIPEFSAALRETVDATNELFTKFVQLGGDKQSSILHNRAFPECQQAQNECSLLRSELNMLKMKLDECQSQKETYHTALIAAENRYERSLSASVQLVESRKESKDRESGKEEHEEGWRQPSSPAPSSIPATPVIQQNGIHDSTELDILREQIKSRDTKIVELEKEAALLRDEKDMLTLEYKAPNVENIMQNSYIKPLAEYAVRLESNLAEKIAQNQEFRDQISQLQPVRIILEDISTSAKEQATQRLEEAITKRDVENARLREQREQQNAELVERRQGDFAKFASIQEYKTLLETNSARIKDLQIDLSRCKALLAAKAGASDLLGFFLEGESDQGKFFELLRERAAQAERRSAALEQTLAGLDQTHPDISKHVKAEADTLERLSRVNAELEKYQRIYGASSGLPPDVSRLAEQLRTKDEELEKLRLLERQARESEEGLMPEIERLSLQWDSQDSQLKSKVFDLSKLEERLHKAMIEKAKSDNKYFAAMRDRDAIDTERKNLQATFAKQNQVLDHIRGLNKVIQENHNICEQENMVLKVSNDRLNAQLLVLNKEIPELRAQIEDEKHRVREYAAIVSEREKTLQQKRAELRTTEDDVIRMKKDLEKRMAQVKRAAKSESSNSKGSVLDHHADNAIRLVNCSICHEKPRNTIIMKCLHTFCKECVDARLSTRQRKCPACNAAFGAGDIRDFFMQ